MEDGGPVELLESHADIEVSDHRARKQFRLLLRKSLSHGDPATLSLDLEPGQCPVRYSVILGGVESVYPVAKGPGRLIHMPLPAIPPGVRFTCTLETVEVLRPENGFYRVETLNALFASALKPLRRMTVDLRITASRPLRAIDSPTHPVRVDRDSDLVARVLFDRENLISRGRFRVLYSLEHAELPLPDGPGISATGETGSEVPRYAVAREIVEPRRRTPRRRAS